MDNANNLAAKKVVNSGGGQGIQSYGSRTRVMEGAGTLRIPASQEKRRGM